jgi:hypothetical protein
MFRINFTQRWSSVGGVQQHMAADAEAAWPLLLGHHSTAERPWPHRNAAVGWRLAAHFGSYAGLFHMFNWPA